MTKKNEQSYFKMSAAMKLGHLKTVRKNTCCGANSCLCFTASSIILTTLFCLEALNTVGRKKSIFKHYFSAHMMERKGRICVSGILKTGKPRNRDPNVWFILQNMFRIFKVILKGC